MRKPPLSKTRSQTVINKWRDMSDEERATRSESLRAKKKAYWASLTPEQIEDFKRKTAEGRRRSSHWNGALRQTIPRGIYRAHGVPEDEIEYLMSLTDTDRKMMRLRQRLYGLSPIAYRDMLAKQQSRCGLCDKEMTNHIAVDHDHHTGRVRGLLCKHCNLALGHLEDRGAAWVERAFHWITDPEATSGPEDG
jgi:hypothetical protein